MIAPTTFVIAFCAICCAAESESPTDLPSTGDDECVKTCNKTYWKDRDTDLLHNSFCQLYNAAWYAKVCKMNQVLKECLEKCPESTTKSDFAKFLENEEKKQLCRKAKVLESLGEATLKCIVETCEDIDKESEDHCGTSGFIVRAREMARLHRESDIDQLTEEDLEVISQVCQYEYCYRSRVEILIKMHAECDAKPALLLLNANVQLLKGYAAELEKSGKNPQRCSYMLSEDIRRAEKEDTSTAVL